MRVIVGMSGGVDSSVTAHLLREQGWEVEGVSFILYEARLKNTFTGCCSVEAINNAQRTAEQLGVRHSRLDLRNEFMEKVIEPFIDAYAQGITPNPCILCNRFIKFPYLLKIASEKNAEFIATGHYARAEDGELLKGRDVGKDQSYFLYILSRGALSRLILPLGEMRKDKVREIARGLHLPAAERPESQEICFIGDKNYFTFIDQLLSGEREPGPIVDIESKKVVGMHKGIYAYTVGQRKGLNVSSPVPLYVVKIEPRSNTVYVGPRDAVMHREIVLKDVTWLVPKHGEFRATVKVRSMMKDEPATISLTDRAEARIVFDEPQWAPAPGQSAVLYDGDLVVGGGVISG
jgi:tRNA-specific 2-thiouridylase